MYDMLQNMTWETYWYNICIFQLSNAFKMPADPAYTTFSFVRVFGVNMLYMECLQIRNYFYYKNFFTCIMFFMKPFCRLFMYLLNKHRILSKCGSKIPNNIRNAKNVEFCNKFCQIYTFKTKIYTYS